MIFRILYGAIYSLLIVALTGIPQTASAVVSCQDTINQNTSIRYFDALSSIFAYNGKTYAIAKSASTGGTSAAEVFFDFSANITRAYLMTGDATGSLKNLLSSGQYGAATPVKIDSADTQKFILDIYGKYLGSTYIDAWKDFGPSGFTTIDGTTLPYANWATAVYTGPDPQAVVMGVDGKWISGIDGARTTQIVQFDGILDCAVLLPSASAAPQPGTGSGAGSSTTPPTSGPDLTKPVCGQDLNGNGYAGDPGETANCLQTAQGQFCPVGAVNCVESYSSPVCPGGSTLNTSRDMCQAGATVTCGVGYTYDASIDKCVEQVACPGGGTFNPVTDQCEKLVLNQCPSGYTYDSSQDVCRKSVDCFGGSLNSNRDRCEIPPTWNCPTGFTYNAASLRCEASPYCPSGTTYIASRDRCEASVGSCPAGYNYNTVLDKCTASVSCPAGGSLNGTTDNCELISSISCLSGTTYNAATGKCESTPTCGSPGTYNTTYDLCLTPSTGATCPSGYTYSSTYGTCIATPSCVGGIYSNANNQCEATPSYSCPDASYTYNASAGRCEKSPFCSQGIYNSVYNVCLQTVIPACPSGYSYNSTTSRCEMMPVCPSGTIFNSITNRCEVASTAITGYAQPVTGKTEIIKYKGRGDTSTGITQFSTSPPALDSLSFDFILQNGQVVLKQECAWGGSGNCGCPSPHWNGWCRAGTDLTQTTSGNTLTVIATIWDSGDCISWSCPDGSSASYNPDSGNYNCITTDPWWNTTYVYDQYGNLLTASCLSYDKIYTTGAAASAALSEFLSCPSGYTLTRPPSSSTCTTIVSQWGAQTGITDCTQSGLYACSAPANACSSGYTLSGSVCYQNPTCPGGSFDYSTHVCYVSYNPTCPGGTTYDATIGSCTVAPTCSNGLLDGSRDVCYQSANAGCASGYTLSGSICTATPLCASGGNLDGSIDFCKAAATWNCPAGYSYRATYGQCYQTANCGAGSLNGTLDVCQQSFSLTCPSGYSLNGTTCQATPPCAAGGSYNVSLDLCDGGSNVCSSPLVLDSAVDKCFQAASCSGGMLNAATDKCESAATPDCGSWVWDGTAQVCYSPPVCSLGAYDDSDNECRAIVTKNCGTYGWSSTQGKCTWQVVCPKDSGYSLSSTVAYSSTLDKCVSDAQHDCPTGTTYNGLPIEKCEAVPICTGDGIYNATVHSCFLGMNSCPLGTQYTCMSNNGTMQCSPNQCFSAGASGTEQITTMDESMMQNDGQRDQNGNCLDQLYVFNGKASRCRPPGLTVGYINNCCDSGKVGSDDMGGNIAMVANGIQTAYQLGQVAYYGNALATGAAQIASITTSTSGAVTGMTVVTTSGSTATLSGATASGAYGALASGATGAEAVTAGITEYVGALLNPATIAVAVVVLVVMKVLMGSGCDQTDIQTGMQAASKDCHYIGDYCEKKWPMVGCVQKAKSHCCFNTKMARIIHEQGRSQLVSFGADGGWGAPSAPNCRGFTPDEFQYLDFSRIDLSEYFEDVQKDLGTKIQGAQTAIQNKVQQHSQNTTGGI